MRRYYCIKDVIMRYTGTRTFTKGQAYEEAPLLGPLAVQAQVNMINDQGRIHHIGTPDDPDFLHEHFVELPEGHDEPRAFLWRESYKEDGELYESFIDYKPQDPYPGYTYTPIYSWRQLDDPLQDMMNAIDQELEGENYHSFYAHEAFVEAMRVAGLSDSQIINVIWELIKAKGLMVGANG